MRGVKIKQLPRSGVARISVKSTCRGRLRSASACAPQKDTHLLIVPRDKLLMFCDTYPQLGYRLMCNLAVDLAMKIRGTDLRI
jgi:hypothetical protein